MLTRRKTGGEWAPGAARNAGAVPGGQNGAPLRLVVPWKYGFKGIKSIVEIWFTDRQPRTTWNIAQPSEYGFYANVNPNVPHPRWSQATERRIGQTERIPTQMFNGYADQVAHLYRDLDLTALDGAQPRRAMKQATTHIGDEALDRPAVAVALHRARGRLQQELAPLAGGSR